MNLNNLNYDSDLEEAAVKWLIRLTSGEMTTQEKQEFEAWINANSLHRQAFEHIQQLWDDTNQLTYDPKTSQVTVKHRPRVAAKRRPQRTRGNWSQSVMAGTAVMATCLALIWWNGWHWRVMSDYTTDEQRQTVQLSDSVEITLDAQTALDINRLPGKTHVTLRSGAAWFKVKGRPDEHVVEVLAGQVSVISLGTEFLVEHRSAHQFVAVTEHAVEVASQSSPLQKTQLQEGYGISMDTASTRPWQKTAIDPAVIGAWRHGQLIFENTPLQHVIERLDDYYPGLLLITDNTLLYQKVSGVFDIDHPDRALASLQLAFPVTIRQVSPYLVLISKA